MPLARARRRR